MSPAEKANFMDSVNNGIDGILADDPKYDVSESDSARYALEGKKIIERESGITDDGVVAVTLNGVTTYF